MDDLAFLRSRIESYADYTNTDDRHLTDEQIRAYAGEALSRLAERLQPSGAPGEALARAVLRCQFVDYRLVPALDSDTLGDALIAALHAADRDIVALADRTDDADAGAAAGCIAEIDAAFDRRSEMLVSGVAAVANAPLRAASGTEPI